MFGINKIQHTDVITNGVIIKRVEIVVIVMSYKHYTTTIIIFIVIYVK
jgi:hypothetical protein